MSAAQTWEVWSTTAHVVVLDDAALAPAVAEVRDVLSAVDAAASRFRWDSEISRIASGPGGEHEISPLLADLVRTALDAARDTDGVVDPTVGRALERLGYDRDIRLVLDGDRPVARVGRLPGWRLVHLDGTCLTVPKGLLLDLGATAKARAADLAAERVATRVGTGVLVSLGGDIATAGPAPAGDWQVLVQDTVDDPAQRVSLPAGGALATSSTVRRTWRRGAQRLHHLLDPATGAPAPAVWRSVSVAAEDCVRANVAATEAAVLGVPGVDRLRRRGLAARLVAADHQVTGLGGWPTSDVA